VVVGELRERLLGPGAKARRWEGIILGAVVLAPVFMLCLYPPTAWDATAYHLPAAVSFLDHGGLHTGPDLKFPVFPYLQELLDVGTLAIGWEAGTGVVLLLVGIGTRLGLPRAGWWAAGLWLGSPLVAWISSSAYIDCGLALFATAAIAAFLAWLGEDQVGWVVVAGGCAGFAASSKYTGLVVAGCLGLLLLRGGGRWRLGPALWFGAACLTVAGGWYLRNTILSGNPIYPAFARVIPTCLGDVTDLEAMQGATRGWGPPKTLPNLLGVPFTTVLNPKLFSGETLLSPFMLGLAPLAVVGAWRERRLRGLLGMVGVFGIVWFWSAPQLRYLLPVLPIACLTACAGAAHLAGKLEAKPAVAVAVTLGLLCPGWTYAWYKVWKAGPLPVGQDGRDVYLTRLFPTYPAYRLLNQLHGRSYTVYALLDERMPYYAKGHFRGDWFGPFRFDLVKKARSGAELEALLRRFGAGYLLVNQARGSIELPRDSDFERSFKLVWSGENAVLYQLSGCQVAALDTPG
jgi:hypothetical protein